MKVHIKNPLCEAWHADPEARYYNGKYYIYVTRSAPFEEQLNHDCFVSENLSDWRKIEGIIDMGGFPWVKKAVWAPTIIEKNGKYYYIFASNDIHHDNEGGGLEIAVADSPEGPFKAYLDKALIGEFINGAQPIDAHLFKDDDGTVYLYYGGWDHCNMAVMNDDMTGFVPFSDGSLFKEVTPDGYKEGPCMMKRNGRYYFMWSSGGWTNGTYCVNYAIADSPFGPFKRENTILSAQKGVAEGPGHNGYLSFPGGECLMVYHRRRYDMKNAHARFLCIDKMEFDGEKIKPVVMTDEWEGEISL